jgi:hypothetical protein
MSTPRRRQNGRRHLIIEPRGKGATFFLLGAVIALAFDLWLRS